MLERILPPQTRVVVSCEALPPYKWRRGLRAVFFVTIVWPDGKRSFLPQIFARSTTMTASVETKIRKAAKLYATIRAAELAAESA